MIFKSLSFPEACFLILLTFHGVDSDVSIDNNDDWSHCFTGNNCERVVRVVTESCVFDL